MLTRDEKKGPISDIIPVSFSRSVLDLEIQVMVKTFVLFYQVFNGLSEGEKNKSRE